MIYERSSRLPSSEDELFVSESDPAEYPPLELRRFNPSLKGNDDGAVLLCFLTLFFFKPPLPDRRNFRSPGRTLLFRRSIDFFFLTRAQKAKKALFIFNQSD